MIRPGQISYYISGKAQPVFPGSALWDRPLPGKGRSPGTTTIGQYLTAAGAFLSDPDSTALADAVAALTGGSGRAESLDISLEKHGAFYHPLKITVKTTGGGACTLVLNGAVDRPGLDLIEQEYGLLESLGETVTPAYIPRVFGMGGGGEAAFFLGEWLQGFYEFHVTRTAGEEGVVVWGPGEDVRHFTYEAAEPIYEQAACILTLYYDARTGAGIFPWHHAAGDFVADPGAVGLPVRLITVRGFSPLAETESGDGNILPPLLFFFLSTMLRMRLDRLDGTGDTVMMKHPVAEAAVRGFFKGLPLDLQGAFEDFLWGFGPDQLEAVTANLVDAWHPGASELAVIRENLTAHCAEIHRILKNR